MKAAATVAWMVVTACSGRGDGTAVGSGSGSASNDIGFWWIDAMADFEVPMRPAPLKPEVRTGPDLVLGTGRLCGFSAVVRDDAKVVTITRGPAVVLYDAQSGAQLHYRKAEDSVEIAPGGRFAVERRGDKLATWRIDDDVSIGEIAADGAGTQLDQLALSSDGTRLATIVGTNAVVRDTATGKVIATVAVPTIDAVEPGVTPMPMVELPAPDRLVVWIGRGPSRNVIGQVVVWDLATSRELRRLPVPDNRHRVPGGWLAMSSSDTNAFWATNVVDGMSASAPFAIVAIDPKRTRAATQWSYSAMRLFDRTRTLQAIVNATIDIRHYTYFDPSFSPDGRWMAWADDGAVRVLDLEKRIILDHGPRIGGTIVGVTQAGDDLVVITKEALHRFAAATGASRGPAKPHPAETRFLSVGPRPIVAKGSSIVALDLVTGDEQRFSESAGGYWQGGYDPKRKQLILAQLATVSLTDESGKRWSIQPGDAYPVVAPSGTVAAGAMPDGAYLFHHGAPGKTTTLPDPPCAKVSAQQLSPSGDHFAVATTTGHVRVWSVATRKSRTVPAPPAMGYLAVANGGAFVVGGKENALWIAPASGAPTAVDRSAPIEGLDVLPDGRIAVTLGDSTIEIWTADKLASAGAPVADPGAAPTCRR